LSKALGAAGLRLGYLAGHPSLVDALREVTLPYHVSTLTQAAAQAVLEHAPEQFRHAHDVMEERDRLSDALRTAGFDVRRSFGNFLQFGVFPDASEMAQALRDRGVLTRVAGEPGWLRVTVGTPEENGRFLSAATEAVAGRGTT
jgi:histidinol-phosphate aminotransferase